MANGGFVTVGQASSEESAVLIGPEGMDFLDRVVPPDSRDSVRNDCVAILRKAVPSAQPVGSETGLVIGYVQSGKTMSFEAVTALARDNAYQIVIVVAGTSNPLLNQSTERLRRDLGLDDASRSRRWLQLTNPDDSEANRQKIRNVLEEWKEGEIPAFSRKTVLITVLKHYQRLASLTTLLSKVGTTGVPTLIIDDEADQASLNTNVSKASESSTYASLMQLKAALPNHTYLQYTATPQAPLLISLIDALSPTFVRVINPGAAYVGGKDFFDDEKKYVRVIPPQDIPSRDNPLNGPPGTLLHALRLFLLGVAAGLEADGGAGNRSMLVHPSQLTVQHQEFFIWVKNAFERWKAVLGLEEDDPERIELIEEFRAVYDDLKSTAADELGGFDVIQKQLKRAMRQTQYEQVNASGGATPRIDWGQSYGWILVGGQAMDRGFTVEGLTVTYMPRGKGVGNADTVQQRARFFGYKRNYLGFCRVYLSQTTIDAFDAYVEHEEDIRQQLKKFQDQGRSLGQWKRAFILDRDLRPCRQSVLALPYMRGELADKWFAPEVILAVETVLQENRQIVDGFITNAGTFSDMDGDPGRTAVQRHKVSAQIPLKGVLENLLTLYRVVNSVDSQEFTGMLLQIDKALEENPDEVCRIVLMSPLERRTRGVNEEGEVTNLYQGAYPVNPPEKRGSIYKGDQSVCFPNMVTIQVHQLDLFQENEGVRARVASDVRVLATWVPARLAKGWVVQAEN